MKKKKKTILASLVAAVFCTPALSSAATGPETAPAAQTAPVESVAPVKPAVAVKKQDMTSKLPADLIEELKNSGDHNKEIDDLLRLKSLAQAQSDLAKAELERDKARLDLKRLSEPEPSPIAAAPNMLAGLGLSAPLAVAPAPVAEAEKPKVVDTSILDEIFVTRIYVFGDKKSATVYLKNSVTDAEVGEEIAPGVKMVAMTDRAATFEYKGKKRSVRLSTQDQAYGRSNEQASKSTPSSQTQFGLGAFPTMPMPTPAPTPAPPPFQALPKQSALPTGMSMPTMPTSSGGSAMPTFSGGLGSKMSAPPGF